MFEDFHFLTTMGGYEYPRHQHRNYEVILVERGPYRCELNGVELQVESGEMLVIKPGDWHQDHFRTGQRHFVLHFRVFQGDFSGAASGLFREGVEPREQLASGEHGYNAVLLGELRREAEQGEKYAGAVQDALLEGLFWRIFRSLPPRSLSLEMRQLPEREAEREGLASAFSQWLERPATVSDVARSLNISTRQLANRCQSAFGESPARLLAELKIQRAESLLRFHGLRVQEVSYQLGFSNPFHFSRVFKRLRGHAPSEV